MFVPAAYDWGLWADQSLGKLGSIGFSMTAIARPAEAIATMNINLGKTNFKNIRQIEVVLIYKLRTVRFAKKGWIRNKT